MATVMNEIGKEATGGAGAEGTAKRSSTTPNPKAKRSRLDIGGTGGATGSTGRDTGGAGRDTGGATRRKVRFDITGLPETLTRLARKIQRRERNSAPLLARHAKALVHKYELTPFVAARCVAAAADVGEIRRRSAGYKKGRIRDAYLMDARDDARLLWTWYDGRSIVPELPEDYLQHPECWRTVFECEESDEYQDPRSISIFVVLRILRAMRTHGVCMGCERSTIEDGAQMPDEPDALRFARRLRCEHCGERSLRCDLCECEHCGR